MLGNDQTGPNIFSVKSLSDSCKGVFVASYLVEIILTQRTHTCCFESNQTHTHKIPRGLGILLPLMAFKEWSTIGVF